MVIKEQNSHKNSRAVFLLGAFFLLIIVSFTVKQIIKIKSSVYSHIYRSNFIIVDKDKNLGVFSLSSSSSVLIKLPQDDRSSLPIMDFFLIDQELSQIKDLKKWFMDLMYQGWRGRQLTNLNQEDLFVLWKKAFFQGKNNFKEVNYSRQNLSEILKDFKIGEEALSVEILNSTVHNGLAKSLSDILETSGVRVVRLSDTNTKAQNCQLLFNDNEIIDSYTVSTITKITNCQLVEDNSSNNRADITIILGEDYWKKLSEKW